MTKIREIQRGGNMNDKEFDEWFNKNWPKA